MLLKARINAAKKRFLNGKLAGIASLIDHLQAGGRESSTPRQLGLEPPVQFEWLAHKSMLEELEYLSKCYTSVPDEVMQAFDEGCRKIVADAKVKGTSHAAAR